jgi:hypothetical protein
VLEMMMFVGATVLKATVLVESYVIVGATVLGATVSRPRSQGHGAC